MNTWEDPSLALWPLSTIFFSGEEAVGLSVSEEEVGEKAGKEYS